MYAGRGCGRGNTDADQKGLRNDPESHTERAIDKLRSKTDQQEWGNVGESEVTDLEQGHQ